MNRRRFVLRASSTLVATVAGCRESVGPISTDPSQIVSRPGPPSKTPAPGRNPLDLGDDRDGFLYVPPDYSPSRPASLLVLLHGAGQSSAIWANGPLDSLYGSRNIIVLAPDSRRASWDLRLGGFGEDVEFIDRALAYTFDRCVINTSSIALGGFSDGASYALSLGAGNGDFFSHIVAFSPGFYRPPPLRGKPKVFASQGTIDPILPFTWTSNELVPFLVSDGYSVKFVQYEGGHTIPLAVATEAMDWFKA